MTRNGHPPNRPPTRPQAAPLPRPLRLEQPGHIGDIADPARPVLGLRDDHGPHETGWHRHRRCQLLYAIRGVMTAHTRDGTWVVPPQQAVWLPAGIEHNVIATRGMAMRSLYMEPAACHGMPATCCVLPVPPLLRELILRAVDLGAAQEEGVDAALGGAVEQLAPAFGEIVVAAAAQHRDLPRPQPLGAGQERGRTRHRRQRADGNTARTGKLARQGGDQEGGGRAHAASSRARCAASQATNPSALAAAAA